MKFVRYQSVHGPAFGALDRDGAVCELEGTPFGSYRQGQGVGSLDQLSLLPPVEPRKIICVGKNYADHVAESSNPTMPEFPLCFMKPPTALIAHGLPVVYPKNSATVHYEAELVVVIGKTGRHIPVSRALTHVLGYTCGNDISARDWQRREMAQGFLLRGKGFDTFGPIGPVVETDIDPSDVGIRLRLNGEIRQNARTSQLIFDIPTLISSLSEAITLEAGDVIWTGTPAGVGPISPGDVMEVEIDGIGTLRNPVIAEN